MSAHPMQEVDEHSVFRCHEAVVTREIVGETLLVPVSADLADLDSIFALNDTAAFLWQRIDGRSPLGPLRDALVSEFQVEPEQAWDDLRRLLGELEQRRLVEQVR